MLVKKPCVSDTYDIMTIHNIILDFLTSKCEEESKRDLSYLQEKIKSDDKSVYRIIAENEMFKLQQNIDDARKKKDVKIYLSRVGKIIEEYQNIGPEKKFFMKKDYIKSDDSLLREDIISKFMDIAKLYVKIEKTDSRIKIKCNNCQKTTFELIEENIIKCENCGCVIELLDEKHFYNDSDRLNMSTRYTYSKNSHFKDAIDKFQGISKIEDGVFQIIQKEMDNYNITKQNITREHILKFLEENKLNKYYDDVTFIYCTITNSKPPDIKQYEYKLMQMCDELEKIYEKIKDKKRIHSLNVNYKLMKCLEILGYNCKKSDFNMIKTREKIIESDMIWERICNILGWKYYPTDLN